jgi:hypothetical protein
MGFIREEIELVGVEKSKRIAALFDSGARRNYIRRRFEDGESVDDIGFHVYEGEHEAVLADESTAKGLRVRFKELRMRGRVMANPQFVILENLVEDMIIGSGFMQEFGVVLDPPRESLELRPMLGRL